MHVEPLTETEQQILLRLARESVERAATGDSPCEVNLEDLPPRLREHGASFVTLTLLDGELRGCIGALEARQPLALDVCEHASAAAMEDYRFSPIRPRELADLCIEISVLTPPQALEYENPADLPGLLRPGVDGVILRDGFRRATYLPQVWEKLPDPRDFLSSLCHKMGGPADLWERKPLVVQTYQVIEFEEA